MQAVDLITQILLYAVFTSAVTAFLLYRRLMSGVRTLIRVHFAGGTEKSFKAVEIGEEITWVQDGEEMTAMIPLDVMPGHTWNWGVHYRVFNLTNGADEVVPVPWLDANVHAQYREGEAAAKERYRRRVRATQSFKQIAAGLSRMSLSQTIILILLGLFAGLWLAPIIMGAIG